MPLLLLVATSAFAQIADGDRAWSNRAQAGQIDTAIAAYQRAVAANPNDVAAHARLLRAWRFKGAYVAKTSDEKKQVYATAKKVGDDALAVVNRLLGARATGSEKEVAAAARAIPGAADVFLWDAVNWGEWALAYGKLAAARQGAADRIRREATIAHLIDPTLEGAAPSRVLGRLHDQTPRIPFLTGWASSKEALRFLGESLKLAPGDKLTTVFLAEAMVSDDAKTKARAVQMLRGVVSAPNNPSFAVEDTAATEDAQRLLREWTGSPR
jgi:tetratricopeptide (TPR) repeat protein